MKQEIIDWYSERHFHPQKVIKVGRKHGRSKAQVMAAMEHCYHKIQAGKDIPNIDIARYIFGVAKDIDCSEYEKRLGEYKNADTTIKELKERLMESSEKCIVYINRERILRKKHRGYIKLRVKEVKRICCVYTVYAGFINILVWLFFLNWR